MRASQRTVGLTAAVGVVAFVLGMAVLAPPAAAAGATRLVSMTGTDTGDCVGSPCATLQYAVDQSDPGDTVSVAEGTYAQSVYIDHSLTLTGAGSTGPGRTSITGNHTDNFIGISVEGGPNQTSVDVTIKDLEVSGAESDGIGVQDADVTVIKNCVVNDNGRRGISAFSPTKIIGTTVNGNAEAGVFIDGLSDSHYVVSHSDLSDNLLAGIDVRSGTASVDHSTINRNKVRGALVLHANLDIASSTLDANHVDGAMVIQGSQLTLTRSTVSNTVPGDDEVGFGGDGMDIVGSSTADVDTSTISGNTGEGILSQGAAVTVENSTISGTIEPEAPADEDRPYAGIAVDDDEDASITMTGSIVAGNTTLSDCVGNVVDGGYNLDSEGSCALSATGSVSNGDAALGPLVDNGGPTKTLAIAKGSEAVDAIATGSAGCATTASDQRGVSRPQGAKCDIGAFEADQQPIVFAPKHLPHATVGKPYHATITATGGLGPPYELTIASNSDPIPPGLHVDEGKSLVISGTPTEAGAFSLTVSVDDPTTKAYTLVVDKPVIASSSPASSPSPSPTTSGIANTGANVTPLTIYGGLAVLLGALLAFAGIARRAGRHRSH